MCIVIHGDAHLEIKLLYEQNRPLMNNGVIEFTECYDIILRNFSNHPIESLCILSPHSNPGHDPTETGHQKYVYPLMHYPDISFFDWIFLKKESLSEANGTYRLHIPSPSIDEGDMIFEVTSLVPQIKIPTWMEPKTQRDRIVKTLFKGTDMMCATIEFEDNHAIEPYDAKRPVETTFWIRLCYAPKTAFPVEPAIQLRISDKEKYHVQPCAGYGPRTILARLKARINVLKTSKYSEFVPTALEALFDDLFEKPGTSTLIEDYRINVISTEDILVINPIIEGPFAFAGLESVSEGSNEMARTWTTGSSFYPATNPLVLANRIYDYINEWAYNPEPEAKTKQQLAAAIAPESYDNICHITDVLESKGFILQPHPGYYSSIQEEKINQRSIELLRPDQYDDQSGYIRESHMDLLDNITGKHNKYGQSKISSFKPKGFRVHYELLYAKEEG